jgi:hypothetical protein
MDVQFIGWEGVDFYVSGSGWELVVGNSYEPIVSVTA